MHLLERPGFLLLMRIAFWLAVLLAVGLAILPQPPKLGMDSLGDKFAHMLAFATLSVLAILAFPRASRWRMAERLSFLGALIEVVQALPVLGRDCDIRDWIADTLAIAIVMAVMHLVLPRLRKGQDTGP